MNGEIKSESVGYRTSPLWRVMGVIAIANAVGVLVTAPILTVQGWHDAPTIILVLAFAVAMAGVLSLWGLRRLTERVELREGILVHSVLGRKRSMQLSAVVRVRDRRRWLRAGWQSPWRMVSIWDVAGHRITLTNYIGHLNPLLVQLKWRVNRDVDAEWHRFRTWMP